jgi:hypothetical protein
LRSALNDFTAICHGLGAAFRALWAAAATPTGRAEISSALQLCGGLQSAARVEVLVGVLQQGFMTMAELDYPYQFAFDGHSQSLPGNSSALACSRFEAAGSTTPTQLLQALAAALAVVPQLDPARSPGGCLNHSKYAAFEETLPGLTPEAWSHQRCSDIPIPYER